MEVYKHGYSKNIICHFSKTRAYGNAFNTRSSAEKLGISAAYLGDLERHKGGPSLELFCKTMQTLNISADDYVYPNQNKNNSTYDQILRLLNQCNDYQLQVILATTTALLDSNPFISNVDTTNDTK